MLPFYAEIWLTSRCLSGTYPITRRYLSVSSGFPKQHIEHFTSL